MKAFVRDDKNDPWDPVLLAVVIGNLMFAAETFGEIAYLPVYAILAIEFAKRLRRRRRSSKALLDADRSTGSR